MKDNTQLHRPMSLHAHIRFHVKRMMRKDTLMFLICLIPLVLIGAWLDMRMINAMSLKSYVITCIWEYGLIMLSYSIGTWEGERRPQFKWKGE